jgi:putative redox protein
MADVAVRLSWTGRGLVFRGGSTGGGPAPGMVVDGNGAEGPSPMQSLLLALAGCTGADVVDTLGKMRVRLEGLEVLVEGERVAEPPRRFDAIRLRFVAHGLSPEAEPNLRRAVELSREKYCSVLHTLRTDVVVESDVALQ